MKMNNMVLMAQNKDDFHNLGSDDLLSRLPEEILVSILSKLPLWDAVATSKLSRRWRYLWCQTDRLVFEDTEGWRYLRCQTDRLVFEDTERWSLIQNEPEFSYSNARDKYMSWVYHIIHQHKSPTIDEFKICFRLTKNDKRTINKWIKFAISKNVQTLELDLLVPYSTRNYYFPNDIFGTKSGSSLEPQSFSMKFLKSLILKGVDVDDEGLKKILSNSPVLEHLSIHGSGKLVKPVIHGKGLALKNLDMSSCVGVESVEICDSNMVSFSCREGSPISALRVVNLQKLEKLCISMQDSWKKISDMFCQISFCVPSLQVLHLTLYRLQGSTEVLRFCKIPQLKQLIIIGGLEDHDSLNVLILLVEACPNLERLKIQKFRWFLEVKTNMEVRQMANEPYQHLEVVEIEGYERGTSDLELATYFIQNCVALKKLVVEIEDYEIGTDDFELATYFIQNCATLEKLVIKPFKHTGATCCG